MKSKLLGLFLGMFDLLIVIFVWGKISGLSTNIHMLQLEEMKQDEDELSMISQLQLIEIFFEALPQMLLQSLFLIRTFSNSVVYDQIMNLVFF